MKHEVKDEATGTTELGWKAIIVEPRKGIRASPKPRCLCPVLVSSGLSHLFPRSDPFVTGESFRLSLGSHVFIRISSL